MSEAFVTLATNDHYAVGALVLANSLRRVGTTRQLCVLVTPNVSSDVRAQLSEVFSDVVIVDVLDSNDSAHLALLKRPELGVTFTKLHCWALTQYTKCVFLDADMLAVQNADDLFAHPELSAVCDIGWPDCFNSGLFVFSPSLDTYQRLLNHSETTGSFDGGDQGLLNTFFTQWNRLSFVYNMVASVTYTYLPAYKQYGQDVRFVHFLGDTKPWQQQYSHESNTVITQQKQEHIASYLNMWWNIYTSAVHSTMPEMVQSVMWPPDPCAKSEFQHSKDYTPSYTYESPQFTYQTNYYDFESQVITYSYEEKAGTYDASPHHTVVENKFEEKSTQTNIDFIHSEREIQSIVHNSVQDQAPQLQPSHFQIQAHLPPPTHHVNGYVHSPQPTSSPHPVSTQPSSAPHPIQIQPVSSPHPSPSQQPLPAPPSLQPAPQSSHPAPSLQPALPFSKPASSSQPVPSSSMPAHAAYPVPISQPVSKAAHSKTVSRGAQSSPTTKHKKSDGALQHSKPKMSSLTQPQSIEDAFLSHTFSEPLPLSFRSGISHPTMPRYVPAPTVPNQVPTYQAPSPASRVPEPKHPIMKKPEIGVSERRAKFPPRSSFGGPFLPFEPLVNARVRSPFSLRQRTASAVPSHHSTSELDDKMTGLTITSFSAEEGKKRWEEGRPDYLGEDSFDNIKAHIDAVVNSEEKQ